MDGGYRYRPHYTLIQLTVMSSTILSLSAQALSVINIRSCPGNTTFKQHAGRGGFIAGVFAPPHHSIVKFDDLQPTPLASLAIPIQAVFINSISYANAIGNYLDEHDLNRRRVITARTVRLFAINTTASRVSSSSSE